MNTKLSIRITIVAATILFISFNQSAAEDLALCRTVDGYAAAITEEYLDQVTRYSVDKDYVALQRLIDAGVVIVLKGGIEVYTVNVGWTVVEFRLKGDTQTWWTVREGLKC